MLEKYLKQSLERARMEDFPEQVLVRHAVEEDHPADEDEWAKWVLTKIYSKLVTKEAVGFKSLTGSLGGKNLCQVKRVGNQYLYDSCA